MHELSIAQSVLEIVQQHLPSRDMPRVRSVRMKVGDLSGVVTESLTFCFSAIISGTNLEGAFLDIERIPLTAVCNACNAPFPIEENIFVCSRCGSVDLTLTSGRELQVTEIELHDE